METEHSKVDRGKKITNVTIHGVGMLIDKTISGKWLIKNASNGAQHELTSSECEKLSKKFADIANELKRPVAFRMYAIIKFNRAISQDTDSISVGGFDMEMNCKRIHFDFERWRGYIDNDDPTCLYVECFDPDYNTHKDLYLVTEESLNRVTEINEFSVYTGNSDLRPVSLDRLKFELPYNNWSAINVDTLVLERAHFDVQTY